MKRVILLNADLSVNIDDSFGRLALSNLLESLEIEIGPFSYEWHRDLEWVNYVAITFPDNPDVEIQINYSNFIDKKRIKNMIYDIGKLKQELIKISKDICVE